MRFEDGLEQDLVEALLFDLAVRCDFAHHFHRAAGSSVSPGSAGGSSELSSVLLLHCDQAAVPLD